MAYVLGGVDEITSRYCRLKYVGEEGHEKKLLYYVYKEIMKYGWTFNDENFPMKLAELALREATMSDLCRRCNGKGYVSTGYKSMDCFSCLGSGVLRRTDKFRARFMGVSGQKWRSLWRERFRREVLGIFDVLETELGNALRKRL
tara:strand:+ start:7681 stop:8115 length:435 start_codon:yes stop_codon:yes gene_type:complete